MSQTGRLTLFPRLTFRSVEPTANPCRTPRRCLVMPRPMRRTRRARFPADAIISSCAMRSGYLVVRDTIRLPRRKMCCQSRIRFDVVASTSGSDCSLTHSRRSDLRSPPKASSQSFAVVHATILGTVCIRWCLIVCPSL